MENDEAYIAHLESKIDDLTNQLCEAESTITNLQYELQEAKYDNSNY